MEQENWNCCGFDDSSWKAGIPCGKSYANLVAQYGEPVRPVKEVPAVGMTVSPKDETIIDFGQNLAGVLRVKAKLPAGTKMVLDHFETLDQYGNYFNNTFMSEKNRTQTKRYLYFKREIYRIYTAFYISRFPLCESDMQSAGESGGFHSDCPVF